MFEMFQFGDEGSGPLVSIKSKTVNPVESDVVYGVGTEFELGFHEVPYQCPRVIRWVFGDAGENLVHASGLNVRYGFFQFFLSVF